jgi:hypothetical protein
MITFCNIKNYRNSIKNICTLKSKSKVSVKKCNNSNTNCQQRSLQSHNILTYSVQQRPHKQVKKKLGNKIKNKNSTAKTKFQDGCSSYKNGFTAVINTNCDNILIKTNLNKMSDKNMNVTGVKKRGHQHHPRNTGQRRSNVPADEVIAALRGTNPTTTLSDSSFYSNSIQSENSSGEQHSISSSSTSNICILNNHNNNNNNLIINNNSNILADILNNNNNNKPKNESQLLVNDPTNRNNNNSSALCVDVVNATVAAPTNDLILDKLTKKKKSSSNSSLDQITPTKAVKNVDKKKKTKSSQDMSKHERPAVEGAESNENDENDPDAAEWIKLRCTSERTEIVAERENRRQQRCADYPGLAFGRSIFSSDTMMKFNIIRNELHNIMNTQLKRVGFCDTKTKKDFDIHTTFRMRIRNFHTKIFFCCWGGGGFVV